MLRFYLFYSMTLVVYFFPSLVAACRQHERMVDILAFNFLAGWLCVPWVCALIWSVNDPIPELE